MVIIIRVYDTEGRMLGNFPDRRSYREWPSGWHDDGLKAKAENFFNELFPGINLLLEVVSFAEA
jgi:hypothetical protein